MNWSRTKEMTETFKNIATLIFYLVIVVFFTFAIWPRVKDFEIKKASIAGVEFGPKEKAAIKTIDSISNKVSFQGKDTATIPPTIVAAAKIVDTVINPNSQNWVYIGQIIKGKLTNSHFNIQEVPKIGDVITATDAVYKRKRLPVELKDGNWQLGEIRGVVADNESVNVKKIIPIKDGNIWALVQ